MNRYILYVYKIYRVSINSYPDYKHLLQENYVENKYNFYHYLSQFLKKLLELHFVKKHVCIPCSFLVISVCNQGKTLCSPCISFQLNTLQLISQMCHIYIYIYMYIYIHTHTHIYIHAVAQLVEALRYKPEGRGFDSQCCQWNFSLT